jgi:HSP20 family protein
MSDRINQQRASGETRNNEQNRQSSGSMTGSTGGGNLAQRQPETSRGMTSYGGYSSPWDLMERFSEDVDRMFASMGLPGVGFSGRRSGRRWPTMRSISQGRGADQGMMNAGMGGMGLGMWAPRVDVSTKGDDLVIDAELPGINPDDVEIEAEGNQLIIRGQSREERSDEDQDRGVMYRERRFGSFYRTIPLPEGVNADNAQATFNNGVLEVRFPGAARQIRPERRRIQVQGAGQSSSRQIGQGTTTAGATGTQAGTTQGTSSTYGQPSQQSPEHQTRG